MSRIVLVRHALSVPDPDVDSREWTLAEGADAEAARLAHLLPDDIGPDMWTSAEAKAIDTAETIVEARGGDVRIDGRFGEVERPWTDGDYRAEVMRYFRGDIPQGWERPDDVVERFGAGVDDVASSGTVVIVNHGLALTLFLGSRTSIDLPSFWSALTFPDAWLLDASELSRLYNG